jgi:hypothetical protein
MKTSRQSRLWTLAAVMPVVAAVAASPAWGQRDRTPPTTPTDLRVVGASDYSVTLSWNASTDNTGEFSYRLVSSAGVSALVPRFYTSYTFTTGHAAGGTYSFHVYAEDGARNRSGNSNTAQGTLLPAGTPPSAPELTVTESGPRHATVSWTMPPDAGPRVYFFLYMDGQAVLGPTEERSHTQYFLEPESTHRFTVRARDGQARYSVHSAEAKVTTPPSDPKDTTPPKPPEGLWALSLDGATEFQAGWSPASDDVTAPEHMRYQVYVNGVWIGPAAGLRTMVNDYGEIGENLLEVIAVDERGNESEAAAVVFFLP